MAQAERSLFLAMKQDEKDESGEKHCGDHEGKTVARHVPRSVHDFQGEDKEGLAVTSQSTCTSR
jgi:hypothetical protein